MVTIETLREHGWNVTPDFFKDISEYEKDFVRLELTGQRTYEYYKSRVEYLGLTGCEHVLDAGCGLGQWSAALSNYNDYVTGIDLNEDRIWRAQRLNKGLGISNTTFLSGSIESINLEPNSVDGIFCYGVFMFTDMKKSIREFYRILRPGGKLYLNANSYGWYYHLLKDVPWNRIPALGIIKNTLLRKNRAIIVSENYLLKLLMNARFENISIASEGDCSFLTNPICHKPESGYPKKFGGMRAMLECTATKCF